MQIPLLMDLFLIFAFAIVVTLVSLRFRMPVIVGFLLTGIIAGPHALGIVDRVHEVEILAEIGVILLLFTIGIEFSLKDLLRIKTAALLGGSIQVLVTILAVFAVCRQIGLSNTQSLFAGFVVAVSSTAIVLKVLQERGDVDSPHGRTSIGILIFQDIIIVPMMLFVPILAGETTDLTGSLLLLAAKGIGIIVFVFLVSRYVVPAILLLILRTRSRELFLLSIIVICIGVVWLTSFLGLSLALGAFLAGLIVSESEYGHEAMGNIVPFKTVFTSLFFVSIGMLLDLNYFATEPLLILMTTAGVIVLKTLIATGAAMALGFPLRISLLVGLTLCQIGEFSFILSESGLESGLMTATHYQLFLAVSILTMTITPFIIIYGPRIIKPMLDLPGIRNVKSPMSPAAVEPAPELSDHTIIIGFGLNGRNVARAAAAASIPYTIIETNPDTVRQERTLGHDIHYGDATHEQILEHAGIKIARVVVVAISDPAATRRITETVKRLNPGIHLIVRTRYVLEMNPLLKLGANEVIPEEFETSVEIFARVLNHYLVPRDQIKKFVAEIRSDRYEMLRGLPKAEKPVETGLMRPDVEVSTIEVDPNADAAGKTIAELNLHGQFNVTVFAVQRGTEILTHPNDTVQILSKDIVYVIGEPETIAAISNIFNPPES